MWRCSTACRARRYDDHPGSATACLAASRRQPRVCCGGAGCERGAGCGSGELDWGRRRGRRLSPPTRPVAYPSRGSRGSRWRAHTYGHPRLRPEGGCVCLYHPGMPKTLALTSVQENLIAAADWVCITIGPPAAAEVVLEAIGDQAKLAWIVKHDPRAMSLDLATRIAECADLIFCSKAEASFLQDALAAASRDKPGLIIIETHGGSGALIKSGQVERFVAAVPMSVNDPTAPAIRLPVVCWRRSPRGKQTQPQSWKPVIVQPACFSTVAAPRRRKVHRR